jgi:hypothetical protein
MKARIYETATRTLLCIWLNPQRDRSICIVLRDDNRNPNPARW